MNAAGSWCGVVTTAIRSIAHRVRRMFGGGGTVASDTAEPFKGMSLLNISLVSQPAHRLQRFQIPRVGFNRSRDFEECYQCKRVLVIGEHKDRCPGCGVLFKHEVTDSFWVPEGCLAVTEDEYVGEA